MRTYAEERKERFASLRKQLYEARHQSMPLRFPGELKNDGSIRQYYSVLTDETKELWQKEFKRNLEIKTFLAAVDIYIGNMNGNQRAKWRVQCARLLGVDVNVVGNILEKYER